MVAALFLHGPSAASTTAKGDGDQAAFLALVNRERVARGLGALAEAGDLVAVARRHSAEMAGQNEVFHNARLSTEVEGWKLLGENVAVGPTVEEIHDELMASKVHRDVILQPRFTQLGVGVVSVADEIWVTHVFRQPEAPPTPSSSAPPAGVAAEPGPSGEPGPRPEPAPRSALAGAASIVRAPGATVGATGVRQHPPTSNEVAPAATLPRPRPSTPPVAAEPPPVAAVASRLPAVMAGAIPTRASSARPDAGAIPGAGVVAAGLLLAVVAAVVAAEESLLPQPSSARRQRRNASMKASRSPSRTASTLPLS